MVVYKSNRQFWEITERRASRRVCKVGGLIQSIRRSQGNESRIKVHFNRFFRDTPSLDFRGEDISNAYLRGTDLDGMPVDSELISYSTTRIWNALLEKGSIIEAEDVIKCLVSSTYYENDVGSELKALWDFARAQDPSLVYNRDLINTKLANMAGRLHDFHVKRALGIHFSVALANLFSSYSKAVLVRGCKECSSDITTWRATLCDRHRNKKVKKWGTKIVQLAEMPKDVLARIGSFL